MTEIVQRVGLNIQARRKELNMTMVELSQKTNISRTMLYIYENGKQPMNINNLTAICEALKMNIAKAFKK